MNLKGKKFIALFLAICLLAVNCSIPLVLKKGSENRKHGAKLIIQKKDGQVIRGELIAVNIQQNFFLLLDSKVKDGVIVIIGDVKTIRIVKKSEFWKGAGLGLLIGGAAGAALVYASGGELAGSEGNAAVAGAILFGVPSALVVGILGAFAGRDKTIQVEGMTPLAMNSILRKLSYKAQMPYYKWH